MKIEIDYKFGQIVYLKNDPEQGEYLIKELSFLPKWILMIELLTPTGEYIKVWEGMLSTERNNLKTLSIKDDGEGEIA